MLCKDFETGSWYNSLWNVFCFTLLCIMFWIFVWKLFTRNENEFCVLLTGRINLNSVLDIWNENIICIVTVLCLCVDPETCFYLVIWWVNFLCIILSLSMLTNACIQGTEHALLSIWIAEIIENISLSCGQENDNMKWYLEFPGLVLLCIQQL
jgi:hypothetical protein